MTAIILGVVLYTLGIAAITLVCVSLWRSYEVEASAGRVEHAATDLRASCDKLADLMQRIERDLLLDPPATIALPPEQAKVTRVLWGDGVETATIESRTKPQSLRVFDPSGGQS